jgi:protein associated with RNAse G/E
MSGCHNPYNNTTELNENGSWYCHICSCFHTSDTRCRYFELDTAIKIHDEMLLKQDNSLTSIYKGNYKRDDRLKNCEIEIKEIAKKHEELLEIFKLSFSELKKESIPYKCPVCDGSTKSLFHLPAGGYWEDICKSCDGKGIVWG